MRLGTADWVESVGGGVNVCRSHPFQRAYLRFGVVIDGVALSFFFGADINASFDVGNIVHTLEMCAVVTRLAQELVDHAVPVEGVSQFVQDRRRWSYDV